jgi:D-sedoheptulose 7-phosphate isomerase
LDLSERVKRAKRVYILGNGGSYANSMHLINDLLSCGVKAFTIDPSTLSAFANDHGWYQALAKWIRVVGEKDDLLIAMSGSGKSPNILIAIEAAEKIGMDVERVFGAPKFDMQSAEEHQIWLGHELMRCLKSS